MAQRNKEPEHSGPTLVKGRIDGKVVSKANSRRATRSGLFIKSADALAFEQTAWAQIPGDLTPMVGDVLFIATVYYQSYRQDLDISLVLDVLQQRKNKAGNVFFNGIYLNDRQVKAQLITHEIDRENPRIEFAVTRLEDYVKTVLADCKQQVIKAVDNDSRKTPSI